MTISKFYFGFTACTAVLLASSAVAQTDNDLLNFALNLECLEAEYYSNAVYGYGLNTSTLGSGPGSTGGLKANLSPDLLRIARELVNDEINHVSTWRSLKPACSLRETILSSANADFAGSWNVVGPFALNPILCAGH